LRELNQIRLRPQLAGDRVKIQISANCIYVAGSLFSIYTERNIHHSNTQALLKKTKQNSRKLREGSSSSRLVRPNKVSKSRKQGAEPLS